MDEIWLARFSHLAPMLAGREEVSAAQHFQIGSWMLLANFVDYFLEPNHKRKRAALAPPSILAQ
jgi:hypothetical protein